MGFEQEMSETKTSVAQLASWCLTVALHQEFGRGAGRLDWLLVLAAAAAVILHLRG